MQEFIKQKQHPQAFCEHYLKLQKLTLPAMKQQFTWICLQNPSLIIKDKIAPNKLKEYILVNSIKLLNFRKLKELCKLKYACPILYVITESEKAEVYEFMKTLQSECFINPLVIRSIFMKPHDNQNIFSGNLEYPESFHKFKKNLTLLISPYRNQLLISVLHLLSFFPTIQSLIDQLDFSKVQNELLRQILLLIQKMLSGKYRILKTDTIQNLFLQTIPKFKSYNEKRSRSYLFQILKLLEHEFSFKDVKCLPKKIVKQKYFEWNIDEEKIYNYSLIKQLFLGKCTYKGECLGCKKKTSYETTFQCLKLSLVPQAILKKNEVNILKMIEQVFNPRDRDILSDYNVTCGNCKRIFQTNQVIVSAGNYLFLQLQLGKYELQIEKQINLKNCKKIAMPNKQGQYIYELVGFIFKKKYEQKDGYIVHETGTCIYDNHLKKYVTFEQLEILQVNSTQVMAQILVYKKKANANSFQLIKNIKSTLLLAQMNQLTIDGPVPLPDFYTTYLYQHCYPPPLVNPFICIHQRYNLNFHLSKAKHINYVPYEIYQYLVQEYGGKAVNKSQIIYKNCQKCQKIKQIVNQIKIIQKETAKYVDRNCNKKYKVLVYKPWLQTWKAYLYFDQSRNYRIWGNRRPNKIDNFLGLDRKRVKDINYDNFVKITSQVWYFLLKFYGGGPIIILKKYNPLPSVTSYVNYKLNQMIQKMKPLKKLISQQGNLLNLSVDFLNDLQCQVQKNQLKSEEFLQEQNDLQKQKNNSVSEKKLEQKKTDYNQQKESHQIIMLNQQQREEKLSQIQQSSYLSEDQNQMEEITEEVNQKAQI